LNDPGTHLLFVGDGHLEKSLKDLLKQKDKSVQKRVYFMGFQNQSVMPSIYQSADIFVLPSKGPGETWGLTVNEAMAAGCAVLVSDRCGCYPNLVREGINGHVFEHDNISQLTSLMKQMSSGKNDPTRKKNASKEIIKDYSFDEICNAIEKVMDTFDL
jgi:glycosyltransferase involved in cell wall biosynthesis